MEWLKHSPQLHATHRSRIVNELSIHRQLSTTDKMAEKQRFGGKFNDFITRFDSTRFSMSLTII